LVVAGIEEDHMAEKDKLIVDKCLPRKNQKTGEWEEFWRVYYWCERPDKSEHGPDDQFHWHPDSEHPTEEAAQQRVADLKAGAKKKSIYVSS
jgi:hypothetical protein